MPSDKLNLFLSIGGFAVGILGFVSGAIFYLRGKSKKILEYKIDTHYIIFPLSTRKSEEVPELKILFQSKSISALMSTTVTFSNVGNQTISSNDFATQDPLAIKASRCFLGDETRFQIKEDNQNSATTVALSKENLVKICFDFLKEKESFSVSFLHDGYIDILGELKTGRIYKHKAFPKISDELVLMMLTGLLVFMLNFWCIEFFSIESYRIVGWLIHLVFAVVLAVYMSNSLISWLTKIFSKHSKK